MTSNEYIVKNCPAYLIEEDYCTCYLEVCSDCIDCVVKQVIEKCKYYQNKIGRTPQYRAGFVDATSDILQLFDIKEVNKWQ